jgi:hypothetical protein
MSAANNARRAMDEYLCSIPSCIECGRARGGHARRVSDAYRQRGPGAMLPDVIRCDRCHRPMAECHRPLGVGSCR